MIRPGRRTLAVVVAGTTLLLGGVAFALVTAGAPGPDGGARPRAAGATGNSSPVPVIVPGRPGESAAVVPPDQLKAPDGSRYNTVDTWFIRMMIPHHAQALQMAALAPTRTGDPQILAIAERIKAAQAPEIIQFRAWLRARGLAESDPHDSGHAHDAMPGMQSPEALQALAAARGANFDRMFIAMMSAHHQGAVQMATDMLKVGVNVQADELATNIAIEQAIEITRMREVLNRH